MWRKPRATTLPFPPVSPSFRGLFEYILRYRILLVDSIIARCKNDKQRIDKVSRLDISETENFINVAVTPKVVECT